MKLGVMIEGQEDLTWENWRRIGARVEELGFESLWRSDHFMSLMDPTRETLETWTALTQTALETSRIRFGPLVCPMTFRHPSLLAWMATAVDRLSGGRLVLGVGAGWNEPEHRAYGLPFPPVKQRMELLEEGIEVILRLQDEGPAHFDGRHYRLDGTELAPKPAQRPRIPLLVGGAGERRTLPIVARYADEWNMTGATPERFAAKRAVLEEHCRAIGRDPAAIEKSVMTGFLIGTDDADLRRRCEAMQRLIPPLARVDTSEVPQAVRRFGWVVGTPDAVAAELRALGAAGVDRVMLQHHLHDDDAVLELIACEVLPAVAEQAADAP